METLWILSLASERRSLQRRRPVELGRDIELNPRYVDTATVRWQRMAGVAVVHVETGRTFENMKRRPAN